MKFTKLKIKRIGHDMTQKEFASKVGIGLNSYIKLEREKEFMDKVELGKLKRIAAELNEDFYELFIKKDE